MIAKCIAVLALVAQINASGCVCGLSSVLLPTAGASPVLLSSSNSGFGDSSSAAVTRNLVANGKFPVALRNCGPTPNQQIPISTSRITTPVLERPTVRLPSSIPAPKTISHSCTCYKTILRPRVHEQIITVPSLQRYVETAHKPVVENIQYEGLPINCGCSSKSGVQFVPLGSGASSSGSVQLLSLGSGSLEIPSLQYPQMQAIQVPQIQIPQSLSFGSCSC